MFNWFFNLTKIAKKSKKNTQPKYEEQEDNREELSPGKASEILNDYLAEAMSNPKLDEPVLSDFDFITRRQVADTAQGQNHETDTEHPDASKHPKELLNNRPDFKNLRRTLERIYKNKDEVDENLVYAVQAALYDYIARAPFNEIAKNDLPELLKKANELNNLENKTHKYSEDELNTIADDIIRKNPEITKYTNYKGKLHQILKEVALGKNSRLSDREGAILVNLVKAALTSTNTLSKEEKQKINDYKEVILTTLADAAIKTFKVASNSHEFDTINHEFDKYKGQTTEQELSSIPDRQKNQEKGYDENEFTDADEFAGEKDIEPTFDLDEDLEKITSQKAKTRIVRALLARGKDGQRVIDNNMLVLILYQYLSRNQKSAISYTEDAGSVKPDMLTDQRIDTIIKTIQPYIGNIFTKEIEKYKTARHNLNDIYKTSPVNNTNYNQLVDSTLNNLKEENPTQENDAEGEEVWVEDQAADMLKSVFKDHDKVTGADITKLQIILRQLLAVSNKSHFSEKGIGTLYNHTLADIKTSYKHIETLANQLKAADNNKSEVEKKSDAKKLTDLCLQLYADITNFISYLEEVKPEKGKTAQKIEAQVEYLNRMLTRIKYLWEVHIKQADPTPHDFTQDIKAVKDAKEKQHEGQKFNTVDDFIQNYGDVARALGFYKDSSKNKEESDSEHKSSRYEVARAALDLLDGVKKAYNNKIADSNALQKKLLPTKENLSERLEEVKVAQTENINKFKKAYERISDRLVSALGTSYRNAIPAIVRLAVQSGSSADDLINTLKNRLQLDDAHIAKIDKATLETSLNDIAPLKEQAITSEGINRNINTVIPSLINELYTDQALCLQNAGSGYAKNPYRAEFTEKNTFAQNAKYWDINLQRTVLDELYTEFNNIKQNIADNKESAAAYNAAKKDPAVSAILHYVDNPKNIYTDFQAEETSFARGAFFKKLYKGLAHIFISLKNQNVHFDKTPFSKIVDRGIEPRQTAEQKDRSKEKKKQVFNPALSRDLQEKKKIDIELENTPFGSLGATVVSKIPELATTVSEQNQDKVEENDQRNLGRKPLPKETYPVFPKGTLLVDGMNNYFYSELPINEQKERADYKRVPANTKELIFDPVLLNPKYVDHPAVNKREDYENDLMYDRERGLLFAVHYFADEVPAEKADDPSLLEYDPNITGEIISCLGNYVLRDNPVKEEPKETTEEQQEEKPEQTTEQNTEQEPAPEQEDYKPTEQENDLSKKQGFNFFGLSKQAADEELPYTQNTYEVSQSEGVGYNPGAEKSLANQETDKHFSMSKLGQLIKNAMRTNPDFFKTVESIVRQSEIPNPDDVITFLQCLIKAGGEATAAIRLYNAQASEPKERSYFWHLIKTHVWPILRKDSAIKDVAEQLNDQDVVE